MNELVLKVSEPGAKQLSPETVSHNTGISNICQGSRPFSVEHIVSRCFCPPPRPPHRAAKRPCQTSTPPVWPCSRKWRRRNLSAPTRAPAAVRIFARWRRLLGWISLSGRKIWSKVSDQPSHTRSTWVHLTKADPRSEPGGVWVLLNRKWMRSNEQIRLRCGETKHHHHTGRK